MSDGISKETAARLPARGHEVDRAKGVLARLVMRHLDPETGLAYAADDPEAGRYAQAI